MRKDALHFQLLAHRCNQKLHAPPTVPTKSFLAIPNRAALHAFNTSTCAIPASHKSPLSPQSLTSQPCISHYIPGLGTAGSRTAPTQFRALTAHGPAWTTDIGKHGPAWTTGITISKPEPPVEAEPTSGLSASRAGPEHESLRHLRVTKCVSALPNYLSNNAPLPSPSH